MTIKLVAGYRVWNAEPYLEASLKSVYDHVDAIVIMLSAKPWGGPAVPDDRTAEIIENFPDPDKKIRFVRGNWGNEVKQTNVLLDLVKKEGATHMLIVDYDEVYWPRHLEAIRAACERGAGKVTVRIRCYWKSLNWWIEPPEPLRAVVAVYLSEETMCVGARNIRTKRQTLELPMTEAVLHHFSYALSTDLVKRKTESWSHRDDVQGTWFERVWIPWDKSRDMENLHPTHPNAYKKAVRADPDQLPPAMRDHPYFGKDIL